MRFGAAFFDGTWNEGFDHAEALKKVTCPTLLMQANFSTLPDGTLDGAMDRDDAAFKGQREYTRHFLTIYDSLVLGFFAPVVWRIPPTASPIDPNPASDDRGPLWPKPVTEQ